MPARVTLIQGGGAGLDQVPAVQRILAAAGADIEWHEHPAGLFAVERGLPPIPDVLVQSIQQNKLALKTKLLLPPACGKDGNYNLLFRKALNLFAAVRRVKSVPGLPAHFHNIDFLVLRELTEDLYTAIEHEIVPGVVQSLKVVTDAASRRFFRFAFDWTRRVGRKTIHCVHKANILKMADGLFLEAFRAVAKDYPDIQTKEMIVDNCCMQMVSKPQQFDVLAMGNMYGDLVSDLGAGVAGGISATWGVNVGDGVTVYETFHGGRREDIGPDNANILPLLMPALDLLETLGQQQPAKRIHAAVEAMLAKGQVRTPDLGGRSTTTEMLNAILANVP